MRKLSRKSMVLAALASVVAMYGCDSDDSSSEKESCNLSAVVSTRTSVDETSCIAVDLSNPSSSDSRVTINEDSGEVVIKVKASGLTCLKLSGSHDGGVRIKNPNNIDMDVILDNVTITSNSHDGYLKFNSGNDLWGNTYLVKLVGTSSVTGSSNEASKKVVSSEPNLAFTGDGTLNIEAKYKTGIGCDDVLKVYGGNLNISVSRTAAAQVSGYEEKGFGIKAVNGFEMSGGNVTINANDNISMYESRGIKVDGSDETACNTGKGYIKISGGTLTIHSDAKALTAGWEASEDATTSSTSDDPVPNVEISGGILTLTASGTPRENNTNSLSPEGIEGKNNVSILGGDIIVNTTDDGIQAGNKLEIGGGRVYVRATSNDAIDANKSLVVSGGTTVSFGASEPEGGLDADNNSNVSYTGGVLIAVGGENNEPQGAGTTGSFVSASLSAVSSAAALQAPGGGTPPDGGMGGGGTPPDGGMGDMGGMAPGGGMGGGSSALAGMVVALAAEGSSDVIAAAKFPSDYVGGTSVLILSDGITSGANYSIYTNPTLSPGNASWFNDAILLDGGVTLSGGTATSVTAGSATGSNMGGDTMGGGMMPGLGGR